MGATNGCDYGKGTNPQEVYLNLCDQALQEHGHDAYNGTISTSRGWFLWDNLGPRHISQAHEVENEYWKSEDRDQPSPTGHRLEKWEGWACIPVADAAQFTYRSKTVKLDLDPSERYPQDLTQRLAAKVGLKPGEFIAEGKEAGDWRNPTAVKKFKIIRVKAEGTRTTEYVIQTRRGEEVFATQGEALERAKEIVELRLAEFEKNPTSFNDPVGEVTVEGRIRKSQAKHLGGYALVKVKDQRTYEVSIAKPRGKLTTSGFYFFGYAAT